MDSHATAKRTRGSLALFLPSFLQPPSSPPSVATFLCSSYFSTWIANLLVLVLCDRTSLIVRSFTSWEPVGGETMCDRRVLGRFVSLKVLIPRRWIVYVVVLPSSQVRRVSSCSTIIAKHHHHHRSGLHTHFRIDMPSALAVADGPPHRPGYSSSLSRQHHRVIDKRSCSTDHVDNDTRYAVSFPLFITRRITRESCCPAAPAIWLSTTLCPLPSVLSRNDASGMVSTTGFDNRG